MALQKHLLLRIIPSGTRFSIEVTESMQINFIDKGHNLLSWLMIELAPSY